MRNEHNKALESFILELQQDSTSLTALTGVLYLAEMRGDADTYIRMASRLVRNRQEPEFYHLLNHASEVEPEELLKNPRLRSEARVALSLASAAALEGEGKLDRAIEEYKKWMPQLNWSFLGPFTNYAGSGFEWVYPVETGPYDPDQIYDAGEGRENKWMKCTFRNTSGQLPPAEMKDEGTYSYYSEEGASSGVWFANTYITLAEPAEVQFRLGRNCPVKFWLDGHLIFSQRDNLKEDADKELIEVSLPAGTHRILLKLAPYPENHEHGHFMDFTSQLSLHRSLKAGYGLGNDYYGYDYFTSTDGQPANCLLRITDKEGNLIQGITSSFTGTAAPAAYTPKVTGRELWRPFQDVISLKPKAWEQYYLLALAWIREGRTHDGEAYFAAQLKQHPDVVYFRFLAALMYATNGKSDMAHELMSNLDEGKTPFFPDILMEFENLDIENDGSRYLIQLRKIEESYPCSPIVINGYLEWFEYNPGREAMIGFLKHKAESCEAYKKALEEMAEEEETKGEGEEETGPYYKQAEKWRNAQLDELKSEVKPEVFKALKVLSDDQSSREKKIAAHKTCIAGYPEMLQPKLSLLEYLMEMELYDDADKYARTLLEVLPQSGYLAHQSAEACAELGRTDEALKMYRLARKFGYENYKTRERIQQLEGSIDSEKLFGQQSFDEFKKKEKWTTLYAGESYAVLMYTWDMLIREPGEARLFQKLMVQILDEEGARHWTENDMGYLGRIKTCKVLKSNGAEITPDIGYGTVRVKNLVPGDIIMLEGVQYVGGDEQIDNYIQYVDNISYDAPVYYARVQIVSPEKMPVHIRFGQPIGQPEEKTADGKKFWKMEIHQRPRPVQEEQLVNNYDGTTVFQISTLSDFGKVVEWYNRMTYRKLEMTYEVRALLDSLVKPEMSAEEKIKILHNYITQKVKYSYVPFFQSGHIPQAAGLTCSGAVGDCKDVATLMISMLRETGIPAWYVLVRTDRNFHSGMVPSAAFNHAIVGYELNGEMHYLDLTTDYFPHTTLPPSCAGSWALLIREGQTDVFQLPNDFVNPSNNLQQIDVKATLLEEGRLNVKAAMTYRGMNAGYLRESLIAKGETERKETMLYEFNHSRITHFVLDSMKIENLVNMQEELTGEVSMHSGEYADIVSGMLIFRIPFMVLSRTTQIFDKENRSCDIDIRGVLHPLPMIQKADLTIPAGYYLHELPADVHIENEIGTYSVTYRQTPQGLHAERVLMLKKFIFRAEEFRKLESFWKAVRKGDNMKIAALRKK